MRCHAPFPAQAIHRRDEFARFLAQGIEARCPGDTTDFAVAIGRRSPANAHLTAATINAGMAIAFDFSSEVSA